MSENKTVLSKECLNWNCQLCGDQECDCRCHWEMARRRNDIKRKQEEGGKKPILSSILGSARLFLPLLLLIVLVPLARAASPLYAYVTNQGSSNIVVINTATNQIVGSTTGGLNQPFQINFVDELNFGYITNYGSSNVVIFNPVSNSVIGMVTGTVVSPIGVGFDPTGTFAYVTNYYSGAINIINVATNTITGSVSGSCTNPHDLHFKFDDTLAYVACSGDNDVGIINVATNTIVATIPGFNLPTGVSVNPSDTFAYVANYGSSNVVILNTNTNTIVGAVSGGGFNGPGGIEFSPDGTFAYVANYGANNVIIINTATNSVVGSITGAFNQPSGVDFYPQIVPTPTINIYFRNSTANPALTYTGTSILGIPACTGNFLGGTCSGTDVITGTHGLTSPLIIFGDLVNNGVLTTNGFSIIASGTVNNLNGNINTGLINNEGAGSANGNSILTSYAGSGGGASGTYYGGNTLAPGGLAGGGAGSTPSAPTVTNSNIIKWSANFTAYFGGAGGAGGLGACSGASTPGGSGAYGIYIQANTIVAGVISANGQIAASGGAGGGGGGVILLANGIGGYTAGTYSVVGGTAGSCSPAAGAGGAGQVLHYSYSILPLQINPTLIYPYQIYNATGAGPNEAYTLTSSFNGITTTLQSNVPTLNCGPPSCIPANQPSGTYTYNIIETNTISLASNLVTANLRIGMTDIASPFSANAPCTLQIQYLPNCVQVPSFTAVPTSYNIVPDNQQNVYSGGNFILGTNNIDVYANANAVFLPSVKLTYGNPVWAQFIANQVNNPAIANITQTAFTFVANTPVAPAAPSTRETFNVITYDQQFFTALNTISTFSTSYLINNYTGSGFVQFITNNTNTIWTQQGSYANPPIMVSNTQVLSSAASHYPTVNNYLQSTINFGTWRNLNIYLPNDANSSLYTFYIYQCNGYAAAGTYLQSSTAGNSNTLTQVQSYKINSIPFSIALQNGQQYGFKFITANGQIIYTQAPTANPLTVTIYLPCVPTVIPILTPIINATCNMNLVSNVVTCRGIDTQNYVSSWQISITDHPSILSTQVITTNTVLGSTFIWNYQLQNHSTTYYATINATVGRTIDPNYPILRNSPLFALGYTINPGASYNAIYGILLFFIFLGVMYINEIAAVVSFPFVLIIGQQIGIYQLAYQYIYGMIGLMVVAAVLMTLFRD